MIINQTYDKTIDAIYLKFSDNKVFKTKEIETGIIVDFNRRGFVIGVEVLDAAKRNFKFEIVKTQKPTFQKVEVTAGKQKTNFSVPCYAN